MGTNVSSYPYLQSGPLRGANHTSQFLFMLLPHSLRSTSTFHALSNKVFHHSLWCVSGLPFHMSKPSLPTPISSQVLVEVQILQVNFYLCSSHILLGLRRLSMLSAIRFSIILSGVSAVFLFICPNHLNLLSHNFIDKSRPLISLSAPGS